LRLRLGGFLFRKKQQNHRENDDSDQKNQKVVMPIYAAENAADQEKENRPQIDSGALQAKEMVSFMTVKKVGDQPGHKGDDKPDTNADKKSGDKNQRKVMDKYRKKVPLQWSVRSRKAAAFSWENAVKSRPARIVAGNRHKKRDGNQLLNRTFTDAAKGLPDFRKHGICRPDNGLQHGYHKHGQL
jgi:hypothetical protein